MGDYMRTGGQGLRHRMGLPGQVLPTCIRVAIVPPPPHLGGQWTAGWGWGEGQGKRGRPLQPNLTLLPPLPGSGRVPMSSQVEVSNFSFFCLLGTSPGPRGWRAPLPKAACRPFVVFSGGGTWEGAQGPSTAAVFRVALHQAREGGVHPGFRPHSGFLFFGDGSAGEGAHGPLKG